MFFGLFCGCSPVVLVAFALSVSIGFHPLTRCAKKYEKKELVSEKGKRKKERENVVDEVGLSLFFRRFFDSLSTLGFFLSSSSASFPFFQTHHVRCRDPQARCCRRQGCP